MKLQDEWKFWVSPLHSGAGPPADWKGWQATDETSARVLHRAEMERQGWDMTHTHSWFLQVTKKFVCWRVSGWWFLVSLHSSPLTKSLVPLCPRLYLNVSVLFLYLVVISERTKVNVRCLGLFLLLSLWAAVVFVHLLPFHWFLL